MIDTQPLENEESRNIAKKLSQFIKEASAEIHQEFNIILLFKFADNNAILFGESDSVRLDFKVFMNPLGLHINIHDKNVDKKYTIMEEDLPTGEELIDLINTEINTEIKEE